jgi:hypothetical protein
MVLHAIEQTACYFAVATNFLASSTVVAGTMLGSAVLNTGLVPNGQVLELFRVSLVHVIGLPSYWCWPFSSQVITLTLQRASY